MIQPLISTIALALYLSLAGVCVGGVLILLRGQRWQRLGGAFLTVLGLGLAGLVTLMSTKYWFGDEEFFAPFIDLHIVEIVLNLLTVLVGVGLACMLIAAGAVWAVRRWFHGRSGRAIAGLTLATLVLWGTSTYSLFLLSEPKRDDVAVASSTTQKLDVVPGFAIERVTTLAGSVLTSIAFGPDGKLYLADLKGKIWRIAIQGGTPGAPELFADQLDRPVGIAWRDKTLYVAIHSKIVTLQDTDNDGRADKRTTIISGLPARLYPLHQNNALVFGPDGRLYFGLGSTTDFEPETDPRTGSIVSIQPDGSDFQIYARGLRNAFDLAFNANGDMFAGENQPAGLPVVPGEELNQIVKGGDYGFPNQYEQPAIGSGTIGPLYVFPPHASPNGIICYSGSQFPATYRDNLLIASWMRGEVYRVQLVRGDDGQYLSRVTLFASGMLNPVDIAEAPDGRIYVADYGSAAIYRIGYSDASSVAQHPTTSTTRP